MISSLFWIVTSAIRIWNLHTFDLFHCHGSTNPSAHVFELCANLNTLYNVQLMFNAVSWTDSGPLVYMPSGDNVLNDWAQIACGAMLGLSIVLRLSSSSSSSSFSFSSSSPLSLFMWSNVGLSSVLHSSKYRVSLCHGVAAIYLCTICTILCFVLLIIEQYIQNL